MGGEFEAIGDAVTGGLLARAVEMSIRALEGHDRYTFEASFAVTEDADWLREPGTKFLCPVPQ